MIDKSTPRYLEVWIQGELAGWLCEAGRATRFVATEPYLANISGQRIRPTLSLSMTVPGENDLTQATLLNRFDPALYRERAELPPFFAGLLPEGKLKARLAATRHDPRDRDDFGILAAAGEDLPGAVKIIPANIDNLTDAARAYGVTGGADNLTICVPEKATEGAASLAGVQDKIALSSARDGKRFCLPVRGVLSDLIAKLPATKDDTQVTNEHACMHLAALAGVNVAQCKMQPMRVLVDHPELVTAYGESTRFLAVDRFDRTPDGAVHMEDACQVLTLMPGQKYAGLAAFIKFIRVLDRFSIRGVEDVRQFFIRQVVNTLIGNSDAHLKNFSLLYHNGVLPALSPAYDIVCVAALPGFKGFGTNVAIDQQQRAETLDSYAAIASSAGISTRIAKAAVKQTVLLAKELWPDALKDMDTPPAVVAEITNRLDTLAITKLR